MQRLLLLLLLFLPSLAGQVAITYLQSAFDETDLTTYTFASQNLGTASGDRYIIVGVTARDFGTTAKSISSVTVGGVSATQVVGVQGAGSGTTISALWIAAVPTGTTGNVVVTFSEQFIKCDIALWAATAINSTATDTATDTVVSGNDLSGAVDVTANGAVIAIGATDADARTSTWTGVTEDGEYATGGSFFSASWASDEFASAQTVTATQTFSAAVSNPSFVVAAFATTSAPARRVFLIQ